MNESDTHATSHGGVDFLEVGVDRMSASAIGIADHGIGIVQGSRVLRPAPEVHGGQHFIAEIFVQALGQQHASGAVFVLAGTVAGVAREEDDFLHVGERQALQLHVFKLHLHGRSGVDLQGEDAAAPAVFHIVVQNLRSLGAIDVVGLFPAFADDPEGIPLLLFNHFLKVLALGELFLHNRLGVIANFRALPTFGEDATKTLPIDDPAVGIPGFEIRLISPHDPGRTFHTETANLKATVASHHFIIAGKFKIIQFSVFPDQEGVSRCGVLRCGLAGDATVLDLPKTGIAVPVIFKLLIGIKNGRATGGRFLGLQ